MAVQDDAREIQIRELFDLEEPHNRSRSDTDAILRIDGHVIDFELKSTTRGSVTTVRDFSMEHVRKWQGKHWIIGVYNTDGSHLKHCLYGSPSDMSTWIEGKAEYIRADVKLASLVGRKIDEGMLKDILGEKQVYSLDDARRLHKKQYTVAEYRSAMDVENGYSKQKMLEILKDRARYLIERGSTLNNPHIPESYFSGWPKITINHSELVRQKVRAYLSSLKKAL